MRTLLFGLMVIAGCSSAPNNVVDSQPGDTLSVSGKSDVGANDPEKWSVLTKPTYIAISRSGTGRALSIANGLTDDDVALAPFADTAVDLSSDGTLEQDAPTAQDNQVALLNDLVTDFGAYQTTLGVAPSSTQSLHTQADPCTQYKIAVAVLAVACGGATAAMLDSKTSKGNKLLQGASCALAYHNYRTYRAQCYGE
jgi:hypothetical protein